MGTSFVNRGSSREHEERILLILTLIIGAVVGLVVVAFIVVTENLGSKLYPAGAAAWRRVLIPVMGALITGPLLYRYFPNARGSGIPQTKVALFLRDGYISLRTVIGKFSLCSISLASGIALGREGPCVQVGAGIASALGRRLGLKPASVKALVPVGASAALAAAFNTPIAAVLFSLEEVMGDMHAPVLGSIVLSSATSWIVLHLLLGDEPLFHVPAYQLVHPVEFVFYAVLGLVGGLVSVAFVKLLLWQRKYFLRAPKSIQWLLPTVGGLTVGLLGWFAPDVLGVGYGFVGQALNGQIVVTTLALLVGLKLVATATCYASGNAGGIFGPSLFLGAMMGGTVGGVAHLLLPDYTGSVGAYALVGMGAAFAGIVRVPLTSVIMIFEITRDYSIIVPLMIANLMSYFISSRLQEEAIYEALQHQDGIHLPGGARAREALLMVGNAMRTDGMALAAAGTAEQAAAAVDRERGAWAVVDAGGLRGMVTLAQLDDALEAQRGSLPLTEFVAAPPASEHLTAQNFPHVHPDHPLEIAMRRIAESGLPVLPVVSRSNVRELKGTVAVPDMLAAYGIGKAAAPDVEEGAAHTGPSRRLLGGVVAALVTLTLVIGFLNYFFRAERTGRAGRYYQAGNELLTKERYDEAITQYRDALSIAHKTEYRLALALALQKAGRLNEAGLYLREVLRDQADSGPANLGIARIAAQQGRTDDAVLAYHRAIYGRWPADAEQNRLQARLELADALTKAGRRTQAQAELLALSAALPEDSAVVRQVSRMLLAAGLPRPAAELFRKAGDWAGLGDAEFALGDYRAARDAYREALKREPSDTAAARGADESDRILQLDPRLAGLSAAERYRRSLELLAAVETCAGNPAPHAPSRRPPSLSDAADANVAEAVKVWPGQCGTDEALALLMHKLQ